MKKKLLVIIPDRLSLLIKKGEIVERYYNPGNFFEEIHLLLINDDKPDLSLVQKMVGNAALFLYHLPEEPSFFKKTLGWQPFLVKNWVLKGLGLAKKIKPSLIRCYGADLNLLLAAHIKKAFNIPMITSLHTHPLLDTYKDTKSLNQRIVDYFRKKLARYLKECDLVLPVYEGIIDYLRMWNISKYQVCYNSVGVKETSKKKNYASEGFFKIACVGRQIANKNPSNLIIALKELPNVTLDLIGQGPINTSLKNLTQQLQLQDRVRFIDSIPHETLCDNLKNYDIFAGNIDCIGLSKTVIEAFLSGLPVLLNYNSKIQVPELNDTICLRVKDSPEGYRQGIQCMQDENLRIHYARNAYEKAMDLWHPKKTEEKFISIYQSFIPS